MTASPVNTTTDLHAVIAALGAERDAGLAREAALAEALAKRNNEFGERIEHQAATIDVLKVMSASPGDARPVFELIVERARALCEADIAAAALLEGDILHLQAQSGVTDEHARHYDQQFPRPVDATTQFGRAILTRDVVQTPDVRADPDHIANEYIRAEPRSLVAVPLLRVDAPIGALTLVRRMPGEFSTTQIQLLKTFAEQAVIAISSAETYRALQTRTSDLQQSLEYQTATSDVLKVINQSAFDLQPVLDTVADTAARLCDAEQAAIYRREGDLVRLVANCGFPPEYEAFAREAGAFPFDLSPQNVGPRAIREGRPVHLHDVTTVLGYGDVSIRLGRQRTSLGVPLLREGEAIGAIVLARQRVEPFTDRQIELVSTFADQAVIAIENTRLITEQREALEQQTATAEVLQVINSSPGDLGPVFEAMLEKATRLCGAPFGNLRTWDGERFHFGAVSGDPQFSDWVRRRSPLLPHRDDDSPLARIIKGEQVVRFTVAPGDEGYWNSAGFKEMVTVSGMRSGILVALKKDEALLGTISVYRQEVRPFSDKQVALLQNFAAQAVIAMENARLLNQQREALDQQTATAEVLQVINASPGDLAPVFDAMLEKAMRLCEAAFGGLALFDGDTYRTVAMHSLPEALAALMRGPRPVSAGTSVWRILRGESPVHVADITADDTYTDNRGLRRAGADIGGARTCLWVALRKDDRVLGCFIAFRQEVRPFSDRQIALLENFAAQAVIAMENARLLEEVRQRQEELRITFENMGDGVAMFDETQHLVAWNRKFQGILDVPDDVIARRQTFSEYLRYLAARGEYGPDSEVHVRGLIEQAGQSRTYERTRPDGRVIEIQHNPVPDGGFVLIYADITQRKRNEAEIRAARDAAEEASRTIEAAYRELKTAQANLIQAEKMASLGQLTAGIAHEIKNPLNFVNNFAAVSVDLLSELKEAAAPGFAALTEKQRAEVEDVSAMLTSNLEKITEHGKRADDIVKAMLEHSRGSSGERRKVDISILADEALNLAYHGARAQDQSFNITLERDFGAGIAPIEVNPQDITRVFLNLFSNGFYATTRRAREGGEAEFVPTLKVTTRDASETVEIRVRDNGTGIPADIRDKLFQPFFTTKPTGEGTGLGLSITYDIVTKQHGGTVTVDSEVNEFTEFIVTLPRQMFANGADRA